MMATALHWIPDTLYNYSLAAVATNYDVHQEVIKSFPENMLFDVYYQLYKASRLKKLGIEFSNLDIFKKLLKVKDKRCLLHNCFQAIMDHGCSVASELAEAFQTLSSNAYNSSILIKNNVLKLGFTLGKFLIDAGWFNESEIIFNACVSLCYTYNTPDIWKCILQCHTKLLCIKNFYYKFKEGKTAILEAKECVKKIREIGLEENYACLYGEISSFYFAKNNFKEAYRWGIEAVKELNSSMFPEDIVKVLCQAAKGCILRREFKQSELLIKQALKMAKDEFGARNLCFATALVDYGYYLLHTDAVGHAVKAYQTALSLHVYIFGGNNLLVAKCHNDLAHASYAYGYSTGHFKDAMDHADKALSIMVNVLNENNMLLATVRKIKALILEEIAYDSHDIISQSQYFSQSLELHMLAMQSAIQSYGELNLCTAKNYADLGIFFQSMQDFKEAQNMFLKSIAIKERILDPDDYEVGLTVHQLATLYTSDMERHNEAEILFLRSIEIGKKHFGEGYSKLQNDYRGLLRVYSKLGQTDKVFMYRTILQNWKLLRKQVAQEESEFSPLNIETERINPGDIMQHLISVQ